MKQKEPLASAAQLEELMGSLARSGATQYFLEIRRRAPGVPNHDKLWERWKFNLPAEDVDDIRDYCHSAGGEYWEYKVWVKDGSGNPVKGTNGAKLGPYLIPAAAAPPPPELIPGAAKVPVDPDLAERQQEIKRRRVELDIQRQEAQLERDRRRNEKLLVGEDGGGDEDEDWVYNPMLGGYFPKGYNPMMAGMGMGGPWGQQQQRPSDAVELAKAFAPVLAAVLAKKEDHSGQLTTADIIKLLMDRGKDNGWSPKDMIGFVGPLMAEVTKATGDVNKIAMERMADSDQFWKEKLIEAAKLGGADTDEVEKWRKILGLATDTIKEGTKLVFGRPTIMKTGKPGEVDVPVVGKAKTPGLPAPGDKAKAPSADPAADAKAVVKERVDAFLVAHEQEMLIGSDPVLVAEKLDELYAMLPLPLRAKIEAADTAGIYEALREHNAEVVDRILAAVQADTAGGHKQHCEEFWDAIKNPDEEEPPDDEQPPDGGGGGGEVGS